MTMEEQERRILDGRQKFLPAVCKSREQNIALGWAGCLYIRRPAWTYYTEAANQQLKK